MARVQYRECRAEVWGFLESKGTVSKVGECR